MNNQAPTKSDVMGVGNWGTLVEILGALQDLTMHGKEPQLVEKHVEGPMDNAKGKIKARAKERVA